MTDAITLIVLLIIYKISKKIFKSPEEKMLQAFHDWFAGKISYEEYYKLWCEDFDRRMKFK